MKIGSFSGTSYRHLPSDYADHHESIWVDFDAGLLDGEKVNLDLNENLDVLEAGDRAGFDLVGMNEHHATGFTITPSPNLMAATLARRTANAAILVLGNSLALYNPPQRVAEEIAMLDCLSGGRSIAGFPVGTPMDTCFAYGTNPSELRQRYYEALDLIRQAWTRNERFEFIGRFHQHRNINVTPRPVQKPHPPIWIPAGGSMETWRFCAENEFMYSYLTHFGYLSGEKIVRGFWDEIKRLGKEPNPYQVGIVQYVGIANSYDEAYKLYREPASYVFNVVQHVAPRWSNPPGYVTEQTVRAKLEAEVKTAKHAAVTKTEVVTLTRQSFDKMVELGFIIIGSADEVADKLRMIAKTQNVGNVLLQMQYGNMTKDLALYNTELCGKYVLPQLRDMFANEWEHKWWPKPLKAAARPAEVAL